MKKKITVIILIAIIFLALIWGWLQKQITISVIVPVYNAEAYLPRCLDSILSQDGNYEVILVNDGSTDNSEKILQTYAEQHKNIKLINQSSQGVSAARNAGINAAKNEYITFVDSDDWLEPQAISSAVKVLKKDKPDILLTGFYDVYDHEWVRQTKGEAAMAEVPEESKFPTRNLDKLAIFSPFRGKDAFSDLFYAGTGVRGQFFLKKFIKENSLSFPLNATCGEDDVFVYRAFLHNPLISVMVTPIYNYRNRVDSLAKAKNVIKENRKTLAVLQQTPEYQQAGRRTQMLINDTWLSWTILGISNLMRHGEPWGSGFDEAYKAYKTFSVYNAEEQKSCRNLEKLHRLLSKGIINL